jgi:RHS repeat-associated protein
VIADYVYVDVKKAARIALDGTTTYYHDDHLGTPRAISDSAGLVAWDGETLPFGAEHSSVGIRDDRYTFTGHEFDEQIDLHYMRARYYNADVGRFVSGDPSSGDNRSPQTWNRYAYVLNNPYRMTDPDGAYQRDVHFDLTRVLALAAGYAPLHAAAIAAANQGTDAGAKASTSPVGLIRGSGYDYHFASPAQLSHLKIEALESHGIEDVGTYLHALQDSFSHAGFKAIPGHVSQGHAPDITSNDPEKAFRMAEATFNALVEFRGREPLLSFEEIAPFVWWYVESPKERSTYRSNKLQTIERRAGTARETHEERLRDPVSWE